MTRPERRHILMGTTAGLVAARTSCAHPNSPVVPVASPGGAARDIAARIAGGNLVDLEDVDFARQFHRSLSFGLPEARPAADLSGGA
jgi:hypothetical protein